MQKFQMSLEKLIGFVAIGFLGMIFSVRAMGQNPPLYLYQLDPVRFTDIIKSQELFGAVDIPTLKAYLQTKYGLSEITDQELRESLSVEDLSEYQRYMYLSTRHTTSNPTCICD